MAQYLLLGVLVLLFVGFWVFKRPNIQSEEARRLVAGGAQLVDVRSRTEFHTGHLPGAKNLPVHEIGSRAGELGAHDKAVIVYCASGARSAMARRRLKSAGFTRVYNLGGMANW